MSKLPKNHKITDHKDVVGQVMHRWKHKDPRPLHSGKGKKGKEGKVVKDRDQAIAIALSIAEKGGSGFSERFQSIGFSQEAAEKASLLLDSNSQNQFITGRRKGLFDRENKTTEARGLPSYDIDSRAGTQPGTEGKQRSQSSEKISPLSLAPSNPNTSPPSRNDRKGFSMFEEVKCPEPKQKPLQQLPKPETSSPANSEKGVTSSTPSQPDKPKDLAAEAERTRRRETCKNKGAGQGASFQEPKRECSKPRTPQQRSATQQAYQAAQQQGRSFDQMPQEKVSELGQKGGEAPRNKNTQACP